MENIVNGFDFDTLKINITGGELRNDYKGRKHYVFTVELTGMNKEKYYLPYRMGTGHAVKSATGVTIEPKPKNSDVIYALLMDAEAGSMSFNDFCANFGYSNDSISAFNTYQTCAKTTDIINSCFNKQTIEQMKIALEGY